MKDEIRHSRFWIGIARSSAPRVPTPGTPGTYSRSDMESLFAYVTRSFDAVSQWLNVTILFGDNANESISGRSWRLRHQGWGFAVKIINAIFFRQSNHCQSSHYKDLQRAIRMAQDAGYIVHLPGFEPVKEQQ